jgi:hypothetical protein
VHAEVAQLAANLDVLLRLQVAELDDDARAHALELALQVGEQDFVD